MLYKKKKEFESFVQNRKNQEQLLFDKLDTRKAETFIRELEESIMESEKGSGYDKTLSLYKTEFKKEISEICDKQKEMSASNTFPTEDVNRLEMKKLKAGIKDLERSLNKIENRLDCNNTSSLCKAKLEQKINEARDTPKRDISTISLISDVDKLELKKYKTIMKTLEQSLNRIENRLSCNQVSNLDQISLEQRSNEIENTIHEVISHSAPMIDLKEKDTALEMLKAQQFHTVLFQEVTIYYLYVNQKYSMAQI